MRLETRKYLYDIKQAADLIGEALSKLSKDDSATASRVSEHARIIAFRNILIHGYAEIDDRLVWDILENKLPMLRREVDELLADD